MMIILYIIALFWCVSGLVSSIATNSWAGMAMFVVLGATVTSMDPRRKKP